MYSEDHHKGNKRLPSRSEIVDNCVFLLSCGTTKEAFLLVNMLSETVAKCPFINDIIQFDFISAPQPVIN